MEKRIEGLRAAIKAAEEWDHDYSCYKNWFCTGDKVLLDSLEDWSNQGLTTEHG